jgi:ribonuclease HI
MNIKIISIDGNIGSGKSTLLTHLKQHYNNNANVIFLKEPVDEWAKIKDKEGNTMLQKFYADQAKYSFAFQMMAYISRLSILRQTVREYSNKNIENLIIITERSLYTDKHVFAKMLHDQNMIEDVTFQIYLNWFNEFSTDFPVDNIIYVKTDPQICHNRIHKRSRVGENIIPLSYLQECHKYHEDFIDTIECNKMFIDGNVDIFENTTIINEWINRIDNHIFKIPITNNTIINDTINYIPEYTLNFDGCSKGNPGHAGIGAVIYQNGQEIWNSSKYIGKKTNNQSEYSSLILGLQGAISLGINELQVFGDSLLVIKQINGIYKVKNEGLIGLSETAYKLKRCFNHITFDHVYRTENKRADELANLGLDQMIKETQMIEL